MTLKYDGEAPVLEMWVVWSTPSLPLLPYPLFLVLDKNTWLQITIDYLY